MKTIPLSRGLEAIVDDSDYEWLAQWKWCVTSPKPGRFYVVRRLPNEACGKRGKIQQMHRLLSGAEPGELVDHVNGDSLDNRRSNLRKCSAPQNTSNRSRTRRSTSGFKGCYWSKLERKWKASIGVSGRVINLGTYPAKISAAIAYNIAAVQLHGEFARLNDVFSGEVPL